MANRLANATSPYLLQHAQNPVEWYEWGPEAFAEAKRRDAPILLSVGYAACHWCHVMAHESFEDPGVAAYMNERFVNIKVDREERPDIDAIYMRATQAMTGQGGWPMTCVLTPEGVPFFGGTYFPPEPQGDMPSFSQLLQTLSDAWRDRRDEIDRIGGEVRAHLAEVNDIGGDLPTAGDLDGAVRVLAGQFDEEAGGFAGAPKFPPSMVLEFLLRHHDRTGDPASLAMVERTGEAMARGGMYDQLGGGFARYSVDRWWRVPHFEKMLYDNALLARLYLHWFRATGHPLAERVARETSRFMIDELLTDEGGFASSLDADTDGHEGTFYAWSPHLLMKSLGAKDGAWAVRTLGVTAQGTFERGLSTVQLPQDPDDPEQWARVRATLLAARAERTRPGRDDKVVAAWNGLAVTALVEAGTLLDEPDFTAAAIRAAEVVWELHVDGGFVRTSRDGTRSSNAAVLDDHGCVAEAFVAVLGVTGDPVWLDRARLVLDRVLDRFAADDGGLFDTADDAEALVARPRDGADNASPSGVSSAVHALVAFAAVTGEHRYRAAAESALASVGELATQVPRYAGWALAAAESMLAGPLEIAVVGEGKAMRDLHRAAAALTSPGAVVVAGPVGLDLPLFEGRGLVDGRPAAYVCQHFVCQAPVTNPDQLASARVL